jgi:membrane protein DedA with SNARE-associated domain
VTSISTSLRWLDFFEASAISRTENVRHGIGSAVIGAVLGPICNFFCGCVSSKMTTTLNLRSNLDAKDKDYEKSYGLVERKSNKRRRQLRKKERTYDLKS